MRDEVCSHSTGKSYARNNGCSLAPVLLGDQLAYQRDASAELTSQTYAGDETGKGVLVHGMHKAIGYVGKRIKNNGAEQNTEPTLLIA